MLLSPLNRGAALLLVAALFGAASYFATQRFLVSPAQYASTVGDTRVHTQDAAVEPVSTDARTDAEASRADVPRAPAPGAAAESEEKAVWSSPWFQRRYAALRPSFGEGALGDSLTQWSASVGQGPAAELIAERALDDLANSPQQTRDGISAALSQSTLDAAVRDELIQLGAALATSSEDRIGFLMQQASSPQARPQNAAVALQVLVQVLNRDPARVAPLYQQIAAAHQDDAETLHMLDLVYGGLRR